VNPHNSPLSSGVGAHCIFSRASSHVLHYTRAVLYFTLPQEMHTGCANHFRRILKKKKTATATAQWILKLLCSFIHVRYKQLTRPLKCSFEDSFYRKCLKWFLCVSDLFTVIFSHVFPPEMTCWFTGKCLSKQKICPARQDIAICADFLHCYVSVVP